MLIHLKLENVSSPFFQKSSTKKKHKLDQPCVNVYAFTYSYKEILTLELYAFFIKLLFKKILKICLQTNWMHKSFSNVSLQT